MNSLTISPAEMLEINTSYLRYVYPHLARLPDSEILSIFYDPANSGKYDPNPWFSSAAYLVDHPDVAQAGCHPFSHYLEHGHSEGRLTRISCWGKERDETLSSQEINLIRREFDAVFYRFLAPDLEHFTDEQLVSHYLFIGGPEGLDPSPTFSRKLYLEQYPDVLSHGIDPFYHYIKHGRKELRRSWLSQWKCLTSPVIDTENVSLIESDFDKIYYREQSPDLIKLSDDALISHYLIAGRKIGRHPNRNFDADAYISYHSDTSFNEADPFTHYVLNEKKNDYKKLSHQLKNDIDLIRDHFDVEFYSKSIDEVFVNDDYLIAHYLTTGWKNGKDPNKNFSTNYYIDSYEDIKINKINPFIHYILHGEAEGRKPNATSLHHLRKTSKATNPLAELFLREKSFALPRKPSRLRLTRGKLHIHWVIPDLSRGGGGHMTIFRMVRYLENFGHTCTVWIDKPVHHKNSHEAWETIIKYYQCIAANVVFVDDGFYETKMDALIATSWETAYIVESHSLAKNKFYFVQDYETDFYAAGSKRIFAERTYHFGLKCICASPWLETLMRDKYGAVSMGFHLAYDASTYSNKKTGNRQKAQSRNNAIKKIAVYAREYTERRCVDIALAALHILSKERNDFEAHLFGQDRLPFNEIRYEAYNHGVLESSQLAELYNSCDIGLTLSATNYSLVPQEMMACGLPVVELDGESTRAIFPADAITLAGPSPIDMAHALSVLLSDETKRSSQSQAALRWVRQFTWEGQALKIERFILDATGRSCLPSPYLKKSRQKLLDIVIPTYNGLNDIKKVIASLRSQKLHSESQIYVVDSESSDGTAEWLKQQKDIAVENIRSADFQHGRTRNLGASLGGSPVIAYLTQDATPCNENWSLDIVKHFNHDAKVSGLFGRHLPYPDHPLYVRHEIEQHFRGFLNLPLTVSKYTDPERWKNGDEGWRKFLHFYSDNNSAMRRTVWNEIPYPEIDYGEDQVWARNIIEQGHFKVYSPSACVYHSHHYTPAEVRKRSRIEGKFFHKEFGYVIISGTPDEIQSLIDHELRHLSSWGYRNGVNPKELEEAKLCLIEKFKGWHEGISESVKLQELKKKPEYNT